LHRRKEHHAHLDPARDPVWTRANAYFGDLSYDQNRKLRPGKQLSGCAAAPGIHLHLRQTRVARLNQSFLP